MESKAIVASFFVNGYNMAAPGYILKLLSHPMEPSRFSFLFPPKVYTFPSVQVKSKRCRVQITFFRDQLGSYANWRELSLVLSRFRQFMTAEVSTIG